MVMLSKQELVLYMYCTKVNIDKLMVEWIVLVNMLVLVFDQIFIAGLNYWNIMAGLELYLPVLGICRA